MLQIEGGGSCFLFASLEIVFKNILRVHPGRYNLKPFVGFPLCKTTQKTLLQEIDYKRQCNQLSQHKTIRRVNIKSRADTVFVFFVGVILVFVNG
jgi:hypothetical protein